jgi:hypothetical protein
MKFRTITLDMRSRDTVLAALRLYESMLVTGTSIPDDILAIAADTGEAPLDTHEINTLCKKLNASSAS